MADKLSTLLASVVETAQNMTANLIKAFAPGVDRLLASRNRTP
jgi:hypothetical protein